MAAVVGRSRRGHVVVLPPVNVMVVAMAALLILAVLVGAEARPLGGGDGGWGVSGDGPLPSGGVFIVETLRRLYLQQLSGPGPSCQTNSPNNGCPPP